MEATLRKLFAGLTVAVAVMLAAGAVSACGDESGPPDASDRSGPERKALRFLAREVANWPSENKCFSCHNNGDAARALYRAIAKEPDRVDRAALGSTTEFLAEPSQWKNNGVDAEFSDKQLAAIQFGNALAEAHDAGFVKKRAPLIAAAKRIAEFQQPDGYWSVADQGIVGSPAAYGRFLATITASRILRQADSTRFQQPIARADEWLRKVRPKSVLDAAAVLNALADASDAAAVDQRRHCLSVIRAGQGRDGGWGPFEKSAAEPFDTAVVLLALTKLPREPEWVDRIRQGRQSLIASQLDDGSWLETTRPAGGQSYAQRLSTTGWSTLALLATEEFDNGQR